MESLSCRLATPPPCCSGQTFSWAEIAQVRSSPLYALEAADELTIDELDGIAAARGEAPLVNAVELLIRHPNGNTERPRFTCQSDDFLDRLVMALKVVTGRR